MSRPTDEELKLIRHHAERMMNSPLPVSRATGEITVGLVKWLEEERKENERLRALVETTRQRADEAEADSAESWLKELEEES